MALRAKKKIKFLITYYFLSTLKISFKAGEDQRAECTESTDEFCSMVSSPCFTADGDHSPRGGSSARRLGFCCSPYVGNKTAVFPAKVLNLLCRRSLKQRQWDLKENSINLALRSNLPHMPSELVLVSSDK